MVVIRNSNVSPEMLAGLPNDISIAALVESHAAIGKDRMIIRATIITTGFFFQSTGSPTVTIPATSISPTLFHGANRFGVDRVGTPPEKFFEVLVVAERLKGSQGSTVVESSSPRHDSVAV